VAQITELSLIGAFVKQARRGLPGPVLAALDQARAYVSGRLGDYGLTMSVRDVALALLVAGDVVERFIEDDGFFGLLREHADGKDRGKLAGLLFTGATVSPHDDNDEDADRAG
jgi:hypothetical protein